MIGRPSVFADDIAQEIIDRISDGESLRQICEDDHMPARRTVLNWLDDPERYGSFCAKHARAREAQGDVMDEKILQAAEDCTNENAAAARVKIDAYKWRAERLKPKVYGSRQAVDLTANVGSELLAAMMEVSKAHEPSG